MSIECFYTSMEDFPSQIGAIEFTNSLSAVPVFQRRNIRRKICPILATLPSIS